MNVFGLAETVVMQKLPLPSEPAAPATRGLAEV